MKNNYSTPCHIKMETLFFLKKSKIGDMIMNNNVAPNNALLGDTWINLLNKIVKESTLLLRTNYSITY
jgi:hypothetical protein